MPYEKSTWNGKTARAVAPYELLDALEFPVCGTPSMAVDSPLPLGLALVTKKDDGICEETPLIYVSKRASDSRSNEVIPGWYAAAREGMKFEVAVTNIRSNDNQHALAPDGNNNHKSDEG